MRTIKRTKALKFIGATGGKFFSIRFTKRTTGEDRLMECRKGVKRYLAKNPSKPGIDFAANRLIPVFDIHAPAPKGADREKGDYRSIPVEGITHLMIEGEWFKVEG